MKGSSNINPSKVDDALEDMREVREIPPLLEQIRNALTVIRFGRLATLTNTSLSGYKRFQRI